MIENKLDSASVITKIKKHALNRIDKYLLNLSVREQQTLINEVIRYFDELYNLSLNKNEEKCEEIINFIHFSFPIVFRKLYSQYKSVIGFPLMPSSSTSIKSVEDLLNICYKAGLMENFEELLRYRILKCEEIEEKSVYLSYENRYFSIERIEKARTVEYSHAIMRSLRDEYYKGFTQLPGIIKKMEKLVYTWKEDFIGYDADPEVDQFFINNAQLDFVQATEWDGFLPQSKFGGVEYHYYLSTIIAIESICIKHLQFVEIAIKKDSSLKRYNILPCVEDCIALVDSLTYILGTSKEIATRILDTLVYDEGKKEHYTHVNTPLPPFIRISSTQLLRSFSGCIYRPIEFMLAELKRLHPKDWERNIGEREEYFRNQLNKCFSSDRFITFNRSIDIIEDGKTITDIDACIIDRETKDIAFVQLKWQDSIYESARSLVSKRRNYIDKATKWVEDIEQWIRQTPEKRIADFLQLSPQYVSRDKIKIFVIGRHNGNYSWNEKLSNNAAWCQWYNLVRIIGLSPSEEINIPKIYDLVLKESPYNHENYSKPLEIKYGNYYIKLDAPPYNQG